MPDGTQEEIAAAEHVARTLVTGMADEFVNFGNLADSDKAAASHATDFDIPLSVLGISAKAERVQHLAPGGAWRRPQRRAPAALPGPA